MFVLKLNCVCDGHKFDFLFVFFGGEFIMENKIIKGDKNNNDDFFKINYEDEEMAKKYQNLYDYLVNDEYGIKHDYDKLKGGDPAKNDLFVCSIFAVNFWRKKEKGKQEDSKEKNVININKIDNDDKTNEKANEIKRMVETLNYDIKPYDGKSNPKLIDYDWDFQKQIDIVSSIEKILGAFMNVDPKLFDIKKFDGFMSMSKENYAEFYNVIWAAKKFSALNIIQKYEKFLRNNEVLDKEIKAGRTTRNLFKMNLALNNSDLEKVKARIEQISKLYYYISSLDCALTENNFNSIKGKIPGGKGIIGLLECGKEELESKYLDFKQKYIVSQNKTQNIDMNKVQLNLSLRNLYCASHMMKEKDISKSISDLKNPPEGEIKNNLKEKILWDDECKCTIEKREDFFEIKTKINEMREKYKEHMEFVCGNSRLANLEQAKSDVVKRFTGLNADLESEEEIQKELKKKYKNISVAMYTVNVLHQKYKIQDDTKIDESIAIMHALEIDKNSLLVDKNKAVDTIEKIFFAFMNVDINKFDIKKFDGFVNMASETYMEFIEIVTAAADAYKFIEKYQEFLNENENIDKEIEKLRKTNVPEEKVGQGEIKAYEASKIKLALSKSDFEKVKKRIDKLSSFAEYFYALHKMFDDRIINDYYNYLEKTALENATKYLNWDANKKNEKLNTFLKDLLDKDLDALKSIHRNDFQKNALLLNFSYYLMCVKKNIPNMLFNPEKSQTTKKIVEKLEKKIEASGNINAKE